MTIARDAVTIVIPCFNEADRLEVRRFQSFARRRPWLRFLLVNDGSTDHTPQVIDELRELAPQSFETLHLPANCGKAEAVRRGMLQALATSADYVGFWDADLAAPLEMIDGFCGILSRRTDIEIVFGARLPLLGHSVRRTRLRGILGGIFVRLVSLLVGFRVRDTQCGAKLFRATPLIRWVFRDPFLSRWIFDVEIMGRLVNAQRHFGLPPVRQLVYELPLDQWHEIAGGKVKIRDFGRAIAELAAIYWHYLRPGVGVYAVDSPTLLQKSMTGHDVSPRQCEAQQRPAA